MTWNRPAAPERHPAPAGQVGVIEGALGAADRSASLAAQFPELQFIVVPADWNEGAGPTLDFLIVAIAAADADAACRWLRTLPSRTRVIVVLHDADVASARKLLREGGAADVLPAPVSEPAVASSLDRLLAARPSGAPAPRNDGRLVSFLKAGGGVGATALAAQAVAQLARRGRSVCLADLDLQFGAASTYLDTPEAITALDCLSAGAELADTPLATALASHASGARLLAAPQEVTSLETITPGDVDALLTGLSGAFGLTLLDLPPSWTAWTGQALQRCDQIVLVTRLTVPHVQQVKRQLRMLTMQRLDRLPLTLVCNAVTSDQQGSMSVKTAERALGRPFDVVVPEDSRLMIAALNQGVELSALRRASKLEKAIGKLADAIDVKVAAMAASGH